MLADPVNIQKSTSLYTVSVGSSFLVNDINEKQQKKSAIKARVATFAGNVVLLHESKIFHVHNNSVT